MLLAAARRFLFLLALVGGGSVLVALALGLLTGSSPSRSISLGLYLAGSLLLLFGFVLGNRGALRRGGEGAAPTLGRGVRPATPEEVRESVNMTVLLVVLGLILFVLGVAVDSRYSLL